MTSPCGLAHAANFDVVDGFLAGNMVVHAAVVFEVAFMVDNLFANGDFRGIPEAVLFHFFVGAFPTSPEQPGWRLRPMQRLPPQWMIGMVS